MVSIINTVLHRRTFTRIGPSAHAPRGGLKERGGPGAGRGRGVPCSVAAFTESCRATDCRVATVGRLLPAHPACTEIDFAVP